MNHGAAAGIFSALLSASLQIAPPPLAGQTPVPNEERIESGQGQSPAGQGIAYRIRLLPIASFPALPASISAELARRQCMIPQSFEAQQPENVIHGSFRAPGSSDWAALCSAQGSTTLLVFLAGQPEPIALRTQPDSAWLGAEPGSANFGSSWGIAVLSADELRASPGLRRNAPIDHDAIEDARLERSLSVRYYSGGRWLDLNYENGTH